VDTESFTQTDVIFDRAPAQEYLDANYGIKINLAQAAHKGTGPLMLKRRDKRCTYFKSWLDEYAIEFFSVVTSTRDEGRPLSTDEAGSNGTLGWYA